MCGAIPPLPLTSSWYDALLSTGTLYILHDIEMLIFFLGFI